jgi:hypothetical protein
MDADTTTSLEKPWIYECTLCQYTFLTRRMYNRHKSLYHRGLPMKEQVRSKTAYHCTDWILDVSPLEEGKRTIFTCVGCRLSFLNEIRFKWHLRRRHNGISLNTRSLDRQTHISIECREDRLLRVLHDQGYSNAKTEQPVIDITTIKKED